MDWDTCNKHLLSCYPREGVGYFKGDGSFHPLENLSETDTDFSVDETFLLDEPVLLVHSHISHHFDYTSDPRTPSFTDMDGQVKSGIEWAICVVDGEHVSPPYRWGNFDTRPSLFGREFIHSMYDCYELVRDHFADNGILLPAKPRHADWFLRGEDYMSNLYQDWGFEKVEMKDMQPGDLLFYKVRSPVVNHLAIFVGNDLVATHWFDHISGTEPIYKHINSIVFAARYSK